MARAARLASTDTQEMDPEFIETAYWEPGFLVGLALWLPLIPEIKTSILVPVLFESKPDQNLIYLPFLMYSPKHLVPVETFMDGVLSSR